MISLLVFTSREPCRTTKRTRHRGDVWPSTGNSLATSGAITGRLWGSFTVRRQIVALTCGYGEPAGCVVQLAAVERGPVQLDAVGIVAVRQVCSRSMGERSSPAGLRGLVLRLIQGGCAWRSVGSHVRQVRARARCSRRSWFVFCCA